MDLFHFYLQIQIKVTKYYIKNKISSFCKLEIEKNLKWGFRIRKLGGVGGIRTHVQREPPTDFESAPLWPLRHHSVFFTKQIIYHKNEIYKEKFLFLCQFVIIFSDTFIFPNPTPTILSGLREPWQSVPADIYKLYFWQ